MQQQSLTDLLEHRYPKNGPIREGDIYSSAVNYDSNINRLHIMLQIEAGIFVAFGIDKEDDGSYSLCTNRKNGTHYHRDDRLPSNWGFVGTLPRLRVV